MNRLPVMAASVLLCACAGLGLRSDGPIPWETVDSDIYSGLDAGMTVTVRDQRTWSRLWAEHKANRHHPYPLPRIDFSEEMVVGIFTGERPNGCHAVRIQRVYRKDGSVVVEYSERIPSGPRICNYAVTHPSHLVAIPRSAGPVKFVRMPDRPS
ncbi:protease complex subunit PrcB family protein [Noviherbaspirillum aerium]|uniref:protease complex subunit PrcB family protein n=1 Tax=Noviherbaspirillum aerium TaxID=2588497 RepID=UPI00124E9950|nr:protease complex subunit PrcB family protein [Noviherbaspirillum aerium]